MFVFAQSLSEEQRSSRQAAVAVAVNCIARCVGAFAIAAYAAAATAQESPALPPLPRVLHFVIASGPGVGPDFIARLIGPKLGEALRQNVIVENRAGSNASSACNTLRALRPTGPSS